MIRIRGWGLILRDNCALLWYRRCIVALMNVVTVCISSKIGRSPGDYLATGFLVGVWRGVGSMVCLAVALRVGVFGVLNFPRWPLLLLFACCFLAGDATVHDLLLVAAAGFGVFEFVESVRFGACVVFLLILFFGVVFLTGVVEGVAC